MQLPSTTHVPSYERRGLQVRTRRRVQPPAEGAEGDQRSWAFRGDPVGHFWGKRPRPREAHELAGVPNWYAPPLRVG